MSYDFVDLHFSAEVVQPRKDSAQGLSNTWTLTHKKNGHSVNCNRLKCLASPRGFDPLLPA